MFYNSLPSIFNERIIMDWTDVSFRICATKSHFAFIVNSTAKRILRHYYLNQTKTKNNYLKFACQKETIWRRIFFWKNSWSTSWNLFYFKELTKYLCLPLIDKIWIVQRIVIQALHRNCLRQILLSPPPHQCPSFEHKRLQYKQCQKIWSLNWSNFVHKQCVENHALILMHFILIVLSLFVPNTFHFIIINSSILIQRLLFYLLKRFRRHYMEFTKQSIKCICFFKMF